MLKGSAAPVTYKSKGLAQAMGLRNLYVTFNGYWPEKGAFMRTCSFKETEAYSVCARIPENETRILVVASAGNTARAFAQVCSDNKIPLLLCVPYDNLSALWFTEPLDPCVRLLCTPAGTDYYDAISLGDSVCRLPKFFTEGGAKNIARRDGMGTTVLSAVHAIGQIPDYYFQAIGSGTGAIAAWETNLRLLEDGRFGKTKMQLLTSQNYPFTPIYDAWKKKERKIEILDPEKSREKASRIHAKVLANRIPPYPIAGGLFDALKDTGGDVDYATNEELLQASDLFYRTEGIDIHPAAAVATACLQKRVRQGKIDPDKNIMLNITGGGEILFKKRHRTFTLTPQWIVSPEDSKDRLPEIFDKI